MGSPGLGKALFGLGLVVFLITSLNPLVRHGNYLSIDWYRFADFLRTLSVIAPIALAAIVASFAWRRRRWAYWTAVGAAGLIGAGNLVFVLIGDLNTIGGQESFR